MDIPRLPDSELVVMKIVWGFGGEITSVQIMEALKGKKQWAVPTVLNFLARLVSRGFLTVRRSGKMNFYTPVISEDAYLEIESKSFLNRLHGNSLTSLMASLYGGGEISKDDLEELKRYIEDREGDAQ